MRIYSDRVFTLRAGVSFAKQQLIAVLLTGLFLFMVVGDPSRHRAQAQPLSQPGSVDDSFIPGAGLEGWRHFTNHAGFPRPGVARLEADGSLDETFVPAFESRTEDSTGITLVAQQPDGRILAGGWFTTLDGTRQNFARLEDDGSIDESFAGELSANSTVHRVDGGQTRIGIYDSRAVAAAYCGTPRHEADIRRLDDALKAAQNSGDAKRIAQADKAVWDARKRLHRQGFGTHSVDDILEKIPEETARIKDELQLTALISRWDKQALARHKEAQQVDVTGKLIDALNPNERQRRYAIEIQKKKPIPPFVLELMLLKEGH